LSWTVLFFSLVIVVFIYLVRLLLLWLFDRKNIFPLVYIAPRGLITILLFFQIYSSHPEYVSDSFERGILLQVVFISSIVMTISLIQNGWGIKEVERNRLSGDLEIDDEEQPDAATDDNSVGK
jgi:potassium/hydrogen antiporter